MKANNKDFQDRLFAAMMHGHICQFPYDAQYCVKCGRVKNWTPQLNGEINQDTRKFMAKRMPEAWEKFIKYQLYEMAQIIRLDGVNKKGTVVDSFNSALSLSSLTQFIIDEYEKKSGMFYEECPECEGHGTEICHDKDGNQCEKKYIGCNGTGKIVKPRFAEAVKVIEEELKK